MKPAVASLPPSELRCYTIGIDGLDTGDSPYRGVVGPAMSADEAAKWLDRGLAIVLARDAAEAKGVADALAAARTTRSQPPTVRTPAATAASSRRARGVEFVPTGEGTD